MESKKEEVKKELTLDERKKSVQDNFNKVTSELKRLSIVAEQLKGQFALLEELTNNGEPNKK